MRLDKSNLEALAHGCAVLGAGGGGDAELGLTMALQAVAAHGPVELLDVDDLAADALVMPCGMIGAPTVASERLWSGDEAGVLGEAAESIWGRPVAALMPYEIAGLNGLLPVTWAARLGVPLVDADGMGRAFPALHQQAMHLAGIPASPVLMTDGRGNTIVLRAAGDIDADRLGRRTAASLGGVCAAALCCMPAAQARAATIRGSLSAALRLGQEVARHPPASRMVATCRALDAVVLVDGKVLDVERRADRGFAYGAVTIVGRAGASRHVRLEMQNEYLLALEDGAVRASVPDLISVLATDTGEPVLIEQLRYGQRVCVVASAGPATWRSRNGLALVGPGAFGYDVEYAPISEDLRHAAW